MIAIVDYEMGNVGSIRRMLKKAGADSVLTHDPTELAKSSKLILPGVGAFDAGIERLQKGGLRDVLDELVLIRKKPVLGICLGMQLLLQKSEEGSRDGLGWISGEVKKFHFGENSDKLKVPHMGWNHVKPESDAPLFAALNESSRFYFVHSYFAAPADDSDVAATCSYGSEFCCALEKNNIFGAQFHPEKSHRYGLQFMENFVRV